MANIWLPSSSKHAYAVRKPNLLAPDKTPTGECRIVAPFPVYDVYLFGLGKTHSVNGRDIIYDEANGTITLKPDSFTSGGSGQIWPHAKLGILPIKNWAGATFILLAGNFSAPSDAFSRILSVYYSSDGGDDIRIFNNGVSPTTFLCSWDDIFGTVISQTFSVDSGSARNAICITHSGTRQKTYLNGALVDSDVDAFNFSGTQNGSFFIGGFPTASRYTPGTYYGVIVLPFAASDALVAELSRDPFQILQPANQLPIYLGGPQETSPTGVLSAGGSSSAAFAANAARLASVSISGVASSSELAVSAALASIQESAAAIAAWVSQTQLGETASLNLASSAGAGWNAVANAFGNLTNTAGATAIQSATVAALSAVVEAATAGIDSGRSAQLLADLAIAAGTDEALASLAQAAASITSAVGAGESWVAATQGENIALQAETASAAANWSPRAIASAALEAGTNASEAFLAATARYGELIGAASGADSVSAALAALADITAAGSAAAVFSALSSSSPVGAVTAAALSELSVYANAQCSAAVTEIVSASDTWLPSASNDLSGPLRGAVVLQAALRARVHLLPRKLQYLDSTIKTGVSAPTWYIGLTDGTPSAAAGDTMASHAGWTEVTAYDEANRVEFQEGTISSGSVDNSGNTATFTVSANSTTVGGAFLVNNNTKGGSTGDLLAVGAFTAGDKSLDDNDTLDVTLTLSLTAS